jgi:CHAT domain-containing protein
LKILLVLLLECCGAVAAFADCQVPVQPPSRELADAHMKCGWSYWGSAEFDRALAHFNDALAISRVIGDRAMEGSTINFIGLLHQMIGDLPAAQEHYQHALDIAKTIGDRHLQGIAYYHMGWASFRRHDYPPAVRYYTESLAALRDTGDRKAEGITLTGLGMTYSSMGQYDKAIEVENDALPLLREARDRHAEANALDHIGIALTFLHRPEEAIASHEQALEIRKEIGSRWEMTMSLSGLAHAQHDLGRLDEAAANMAQIIEIIEEGRRGLSTRRFRGSLFAGMWGHYARTIGILMEQHDDLGALSMSERARARLTLDAVQEMLARADAAAGGSLLTREQELLDLIEQRGAADALTRELRDVEDRIAATYPKLAAARNAEPLPASAIRSELLDDHSAIVEYFLAPEKSFVWVLTRNGIESRDLAPRETIEAAAGQLQELLAQGDQRTRRHDVERAIERLSSLVVKPLLLPPTTGLIIVPDGSLFYVPFAALTANGHALIDRYEITMAPSASALVLLHHAASAHPPASADVAVFGDPVFRSDDPRVHGNGSSRVTKTDPDLERAASESGIRDLRRLPASRAEAQAIVRIARGSSLEALDFDASRRTVLQEDLGRYRIVHFATHALINASHPELSGIVLSLVDERGAPVDGFLRVHDLYASRGATDLVVLSACRTAAGKELRGEGIVGLVSGFMNAGTPRVVASYWNVKDQPTAEIMKRFYDAMFNRHLPPAAALRSAQRAMRSKEQWRSPYYWASFALYGLP